MKKIVSMVTALSMFTLLTSTSVANASQNTAPDFVKGTLSGKFTKDIKGVHNFFNENKSKFGVDVAENELTQLASQADNLGFTHIKAQQMVNGIPVFGNEYIVHFDKTGQVYAANGNFDAKAKKAKIDKTKFIAPSKAALLAQAQFTFDSLQMAPNAKLYLLNVNNEFIPVYEVRVNFLYPNPGDWHVFVNAVNGNIVKQYNTISGVAATATGTTLIGEVNTLNVDKVTTTVKRTTTTQYRLIDNTRPASITTYTANSGTILPGSVFYGTTASITDKAAVSAHVYAGNVYDFYKSKFARNGINNANMAMKSTVHYKLNYNNAFWNGSQMVYGDGDGTTFTSLSGALDVVGHEMTHGVNSNSANLVYENQSGALSESISDTFGTLIEFAYQPAKFDWLVGEDIYTPAKAGDGLRNMADPAAQGHPAHMSQFKVLPNTQAGDWGGVHSNCGIPNKAMYLTATNANIGMDKMAQLCYRALTVYYTSTTNFSQARAAFVQSATDLYGAGSAEVAAVNAAWDAVGVN